MSATVGLTVTPVADPPSAPPKPKAKSGKKGDRKTTVKVSWRDPASDGGSAIDGFVVAAVKIIGRGTGGVEYFDFESDVHRASIKLSAGRYKLKVAATNAAGSGPYSRLSRKVVAR